MNLSFLGDFKKIITSFNIPSNITSCCTKTLCRLDNWGFSYRSNLSSFEIPTSVTYIGIGCFKNCSKTLI